MIWCVFQVLEYAAHIFFYKQLFYDQHLTEIGKKMKKLLGVMTPHITPVQVEGLSLLAWSSGIYTAARP